MKLISFEGIDGVGKSTVVDAVYEKLSIKGYNVCLLRDPGSSEIGEQLRFLIKSDIPRSKLTNLFLYLTARLELVADIEKNKNQYDYILLDRYVDSTIAYQAYGQGIDLDTINTLNNILLDNNKYLPNRTYYLFLDEKTRLERLEKRQEELDNIDTNHEFLSKVNKGYESLLDDKRILSLKNTDSKITADIIVNDIINNI